MPSKQFYLKHDVIAEPLINNWYAWSYLIPPACKAMMHTGLHKKILQSYIQNPIIHLAASKNPAMTGGPFVHYQQDRSKDIEALMSQNNYAQDEALAQAIMELDQLLQERGNGDSLESLYKNVPELLRGFVELVYDLNNQPSFRLLEGLLYHSDFYQSSQQSLLLSLANNDEHRLPVSNTPRLPSSDDLHLKIPFHSKTIDDLFRLRESSQTLSDICNLLSIDDCDSALPFLTITPPCERQSFTVDNVRWRYFGHACILIETRDVSILVDPIISYGSDPDAPRYTFSDLPQNIDYVLLTHNHQDHVSIETLLQIRHKVSHIIVPQCETGTLHAPSLKRLLNRIGFDRVLEISEMESVHITGGKLVGVPFFGEHSDLNIPSKLAYYLSINGRSFLFAADSNTIEPKLYDHIRRSLGDIDVLFIGLECEGAPLSWVYGPLLSKPMEYSLDQSRRLSGSDATRALEIIERFNFKEVYIYAMGLESWISYISNTSFDEQSPPIQESNKLMEQCTQRQIISKLLIDQYERVYERS